MAFFYVDRTSQFSETDAAGVVHFSKLACYVEEAEHLFLAQSGYPIQIRNRSALCWPRVSYTASYTKAILPFNRIRISLEPIHVGTSSINWRWTIKDTATDEPFCDGKMKTVCCVIKKGKMEVCPLPQDLKEILTAS